MTKKFTASKNSSQRLKTIAEINEIRFILKLMYEVFITIYNKNLIIYRHYQGGFSKPLITYHITSDYQGILRNSAKLACSFWNRFVEPESNIVLRLGTFTQFGSTIARAYHPFRRDGVVYGVIEFNTKYLDRFEDVEIIGTLVHEIRHTLGIGWDKWMDMFDHQTGQFHKKWIDQVPALATMHVETDYGSGTTLSHWDEERFDKALMSGIKDDNEHILPVTIDVLGLLGNTVIEQLSEKRELAEVIEELRSVVFSRQDEAVRLNRDVYIKTDIWEVIYDRKRRPHL